MIIFVLYRVPFCLCNFVCVTIAMFFILSGFILCFVIIFRWFKCFLIAFLLLNCIILLKVVFSFVTLVVVNKTLSSFRFKSLLFIFSFSSLTYGTILVLRFIIDVFNVIVLLVSRTFVFGNLTGLRIVFLVIRLNGREWSVAVGWLQVLEWEWG